MQIILNLLIFLCTAWAYIGCFHDEEGWRLQRGLAVLRFFTIQSNLFCALASLALVISLPAGFVPRWIWLWKYIGTAAVTVTLTTVLVFLGPAVGYKKLLSGRDLYLHLIGPLLAIASFCFCERFYPFPFPLALKSSTARSIFTRSFCARRKSAGRIFTATTKTVNGR